jgi:hypothetical protein
MKQAHQLLVITKTCDLIRWSCHHTSRFPRNHRFALGERLERSHYDLLELSSEPGTHVSGSPCWSKPT